MNSSVASKFWYPYEEFAQHMRAMKTVRQWEDTSRFGHVGKAQTSQANNARILEYFSDIYDRPEEAVHKAELFLSICDYIGRRAALFTSRGFIDEDADRTLSVDPALLRAVHHVFTATVRITQIDPKKILTLAKAFQEIGVDA
jgi:hypothetical protein